MGRLILELMAENPEEVDLEQILHNASIRRTHHGTKVRRDIFDTIIGLAS